MTSGNPGLLIAPRALEGALKGEAPPLLLDVRPAHEYAGGRLPSAVHLDLWGLSLGDTDPAPLRAFLSMIEHLFAIRGVTRERGVVVYEEVSGMRAARAFWFLEYFGHPDVRVLDGGVRAWRQAGLPLTTGGQPPSESRWAGERDDSKLATWRDVLDHLDRDDAVILDVRSEAEHRGDAVRAARGGAIPGSVHVEWTRALAEDGRFRPESELRELYEAAGVTPDREVVAYCQGAYRAAHTYLALRLLGYPRVRNYLGSWREWGNRTDLPISETHT